MLKVSLHQLDQFGYRSACGNTASQLGPPNSTNNRWKWANCNMPLIRGQPASSQGAQKIKQMYDKLLTGWAILTFHKRKLICNRVFMSNCITLLYPTETVTIFLDRTTG
jgi:hypothetical protein